MKIYNVCTFVFRFVMVLVFARFLNSSFVINPRKVAPTSQFYSSKHVENRRESNYVIRVNSLRNHILTSRNGILSNFGSTVVLLFMFWIIRTALK